MKSKFGLCVSVIVFLAGLVQVGSAAQWRPLGVEGAALEGGATHVLTLDYTDLATGTDTNTAVVLTNIVEFAAKTGAELLYMKLNTAFDTANTNFTGSTLLEVGDSADADLFLTSTELASDGTEVFLAYGRRDADTITSTVTKQTVSLTDTNAVTAVVVTNALVASTGTAGVVGRKLYTAANYLKVTFTPNAEEALSANTSGSVSLYFRLLPRGR